MAVKLEKFNSEEVFKLVSWISDKEFLLQWAGPAYNMESLEQQLLDDIKSASIENPVSLMFSIKQMEDNKTMGHIQLLNIDRVNMAARIGRVIIGEKSERNKGIGKQAVEAALEVAFDQLKLHRVDLGVFDFNKAAIACYEKAGFAIEGRFRDCRKINGEYWSMLNMSILENEYRKTRNID